MTRKRYTAGFVISLLLTFVAYDAVVNHFAFGVQLIALICVLAVIQAIVQLVFFLHIDDEIGPRYKLISFLTMLVMVLIIVVGSLWIMYNMNYNMMQLSPEEKIRIMLENNAKSGF